MNSYFVGDQSGKSFTQNEVATKTTIPHGAPSAHLVASAPGPVAVSAIVPDLNGNEKQCGDGSGAMSTDSEKQCAEESNLPSPSGDPSLKESSSTFPEGG